MPSTSKFARCAGRIYQTPLLILETEGQNIADTFNQLIMAKAEGEITTETEILEDRPLYEVINGTAVIRVIGPLVQRHDWIASVCGFVAYERLNTHIIAAESDSNVERAVFEFDCPGGEVNGIAETAKLIRSLTAKKPTIAQVNDTCASGAYWLAAQCGEIVCTPTSILGSIGVVYMHREYSEAEKMLGVKTTFITFGDLKAVGNRSEPLDDDARDELQRLVNHTGEMFIKAVADGRGDKFDEEAALETEAGVFIGEDAVASGLADRIGFLDDTLRSPVGDYPSPENTESEMANGKTEAKGKTAPEVETQENGTTVVNSVDVDAIKAAAKAEGAAEEKQRASAIRALEAAVSRPKLTAQLIDTDGMTAEMAKPILEAAAEETAPADETTDGDEEKGKGTNVSNFTERLAANEAKAKEAGKDEGAGSGDPSKGNVSALAERMKARAGIK